jgi:hypothetical protein
MPIAFLEAARDHPRQDSEAMNKISETFLLTIAKVSATLLGLLRAPPKIERRAWSVVLVQCSDVPLAVVCWVASSPVAPGPP